MQKIIFIVSTIITTLFLLSSCSSMILSVGGEEEQDIINLNTDRDKIIGILGNPISTNRLETPKSVKEIDQEILEKYGGYDHIQILDYSNHNYRERLAVLREDYIYEGRVQRKNETGEALGMAGHTLFLSEIFMVPHAIKRQADRSNEVHKITVWYDDSNSVLTYLWKSETIADVEK